MRALVPHGVPFLAATATATPTVRREVISLLDMKGCEFVLYHQTGQIYTMRCTNQH